MADWLVSFVGGGIALLLLAFWKLARIWGFKEALDAVAWTTVFGLLLITGAVFTFSWALLRSLIGMEAPEPWYKRSRWYWDYLIRSKRDWYLLIGALLGVLIGQIFGFLVALVAIVGCVAITHLVNFLWNWKLWEIGAWLDDWLSLGPQQEFWH